MQVMLNYSFFPECNNDSQHIESLLCAGDSFNHHKQLFRIDAIIIPISLKKQLKY